MNCATTNAFFLKLTHKVRLGNRTIAVNLVPDFLVGGLWKPDFLLVGASCSRHQTQGREQSSLLQNATAGLLNKVRTYSREQSSLLQNVLQNARGAINCATTNAFFLKLTPMVRLGNRTIAVNLVNSCGIFKMFQCCVSTCASLNITSVSEGLFYFLKSLPKHHYRLAKTYCECACVGGNKFCRF